MIQRGNIVVLLAFTVFLGACSTAWKVRDRQGVETSVKALKLESPSYLQVLNGTARQSVDLGDVQVLRIDPTAVQSREGSVFYGVFVDLGEDGTIPSDTAVGKAWVRVGTHLRGKSPGGVWQLPLAELRELRRADFEKAAE